MNQTITEKRVNERLGIDSTDENRIIEINGVKGKGRTDEAIRFLGGDSQ